MQTVLWSHEFSTSHSQVEAKVRFSFWLVFSRVYCEGVRSWFHSIWFVNQMIKGWNSLKMTK